MPDLGLRYQRLLRAGILFGHLAFEEAQIVIVARDWLEVLVPHDLGRDVGIVGIEQRERLSGDVAKQVAMVRREAHLPGIFFGRILVRRRPRDAAARDDVHLHALGDCDERARTDQRANLTRVLRGDPIAGLNLGAGGSESKCQRGENCDDGQRDAESVRFFHILKYHFNSTASLQFDRDLAIALRSDVDETSIRTVRAP